jgi:hypothetical protein
MRGKSEERRAASALKVRGEPPQKCTKRRVGVEVGVGGLEVRTWRVVSGVVGMVCDCIAVLVFEGGRAACRCLAVLAYVLYALLIDVRSPPLDASRRARAGRGLGRRSG